MHAKAAPCNMVPPALVPARRARSRRPQEKPSVLPLLLLNQVFEGEGRVRLYEEGWLALIEGQGWWLCECEWCIDVSWHDG